MADQVTAKATTKWVLANPGSQGKNHVRNLNGEMLEITNRSLENPKVIAALENIDKMTGSQIMGKVVVRA